MFCDADTDSQSRVTEQVLPDHVPSLTGLVVKRAFICDWVWTVNGEWVRLQAASAAEADGRSAVSQTAALSCPKNGQKRLLGWA
jgi:hypothetical protein